MKDQLNCRNPWMVAVNHTFINFMLALNKFKNSVTEYRYPEIKLIENEKIEFVLLSSEPFPFKEKHKKELKVFCPKAITLLVDGEMFSSYGSN